MGKRTIALLLVPAFLAALAAGQSTAPVVKKKLRAKKPVTVQVDEGIQVPAKITCPVAKDTWIYSFRPDSNYGRGYGWKDRTDPTKDLTVPKMFLGFGGTDKKLVLLDFDVSKLPRGVAPKRAVVRVYNDYAGSAASTRVAARMVLSPWEEHKVTWRTAPKLDTAAVSEATLRGGITYGQPGVWYEWDVAPIVTAWMVSKKPCHGIALDPVGDYGVDRDFVCKEYKEKAEFAPVLVVEYGTAAAPKKEAVRK